MAGDSKHVHFPVDLPITPGKPLPSLPPLKIIARASRRPRYIEPTPVDFIPVLLVRQQLELPFRDYAPAQVVEQQLRAASHITGQILLRQPMPRSSMPVKVAGRAGRRVSEMIIRSILAITPPNMHQKRARSPGPDSRRSSASFACIGLTQGCQVVDKSYKRPEIASNSLVTSSEPEITSDSVITPCEPAMADSSKDSILFKLLSKLTSTKDLIACYQVSKAMNGFIASHSADLVPLVAQNESQCGTELHAWMSRDGADQNGGHMRYLHDWQRDRLVVTSLLDTICDRCPQLLRRPSLEALYKRDGKSYEALVDACWRIWSFCLAFNGPRHRLDNDAQLDWLQGGPVAKNFSCSATSKPLALLSPDSMLVNPPDYFADGNKGGLCSSELMNMHEIWICMGHLLDQYRYDLDFAYTCGVLSQCALPQDDIAAESLVMREWLQYVRMCGPAAVLTMIGATDRTQGMQKALDIGLCQWTPLGEGVRDDFLLEALTAAHGAKPLFPAMPATNERPLSYHSSREMTTISLMPPALNVANKSMGAGSRPLMKLIIPERPPSSLHPVMRMPAELQGQMIQSIEKYG